MSNRRSVTKPIYDYREAARSLWNNFFRENFEYTQENGERMQDWDLAESFGVIKEELFWSIVLHPYVDEMPDNFSLGRPSQLIKVLLKSEVGEIPVEISRDKNGYGYWDHPIERLDSKSDLLFVNLFDWNSYGYLDMSLVMAEILSSENYPDLTGHRLLVELKYTDILLCS